MNADTTRKRTANIVAVVIAGSVPGVAGAVAVADDQQPSRPASEKDARERAALAAWANAHGLSGLSPASLRPVVDDD